MLLSIVIINISKNLEFLKYIFLNMDVKNQIRTIIDIFLTFSSSLISLRLLKKNKNSLTKKGNFILREIKIKNTHFISLFKNFF